MRNRRWIEKVLLLLGLLAVNVWIWSYASSAVYQSWENWVFDREMHHQPATLTQFLVEKKDQAAIALKSWLRWVPIPTPSAPRSVPPPAIPSSGLIGRLTIPRLHLSTMVREGTSEATLSLAVGHIPHTAMPGQPGNVGVAGHRDRLFRGLQNIRPDDTIVFETLAGSYVYQVKSTSIVKPTDVSVLLPDKRSELTLVTCYPFYYVGAAPKRFIVKALQVSHSAQTAAKAGHEVTEGSIEGRKI